MRLASTNAPLVLASLVSTTSLLASLLGVACSAGSEASEVEPTPDASDAPADAGPGRGADGAPPDASPDATPPDAAPAPPPACATDWCMVAPPAGASRVRLRSAWSSGPLDVWLGGDDGLLLHFDGKELAEVSLPTTDAIRAIGGTSATDIWIGTTRTQYDGALFHGDGKTFAAITKTEWSSVEASYLAIWAHAVDDVWFGKNTGGLERKIGGAWKSWPTYFDAGYPSAIWGTGPSDVWVGNFYDKRHFDGQSWTKHEGGAASLWGTASNDLYAAGWQLSHFDGVAWKPIAIPPGSTAMAVHGSSSADVWAVGTSPGGGASILHGVSGTWTSSSAPPNAKSLAAVTAPGPKDAWAVGSEGTILRYAR